MSDVHIHDTYVRLDPLFWVAGAAAAGLAVVAVAAFLFVRSRRRRP